MFYPKLNEIPVKRDMLDVFRGYNHRSRISEGEFFEMENLSSDDFPLLSPRKKRGTCVATGSVTGLASNGELCYTDGKDFVVGEKRINLGLDNTSKSITNFGPYTIVYPDRRYVNTVDLSDNGSTLNQDEFSNEEIKAYRGPFEMRWYAAKLGNENITAKQYLQKEQPIEDSETVSNYSAIWGKLEENPEAPNKHKFTAYYRLKNSSEWTAFSNSFDLGFSIQSKNREFYDSYDGVKSNSEIIRLRLGMVTDDDERWKQGVAGMYARRYITGTTKESIYAVCFLPLQGFAGAYTDEDHLRRLVIIGTVEGNVYAMRLPYATAELLQYEDCLKAGIMERQAEAYGSYYSVKLCSRAPTSEDTDTKFGHGYWLDVTQPKLYHRVGDYAEWSEVAKDSLQSQVAVKTELSKEQLSTLQAAAQRREKITLSKCSVMDTLIPEHNEIVELLPMELVTATLPSQEAIITDLHQEGGVTYITVEGALLSGVITETLTVTLSGIQMDFVVECGNRLWGCRYGTNSKGDFVNEIYASALGDFKNWDKYDGTSTDSYTVSLGVSGPFTGAVNYGGYPIFFREDCMHKIYGDYPSNYQISTTFCQGVQEGCHKSIALVNSILYYKSRTGICRYDGSLPVEISEDLGDERYSDAVAGAYKNKYYISMKNSQGEYSLFSYDSEYELWHREDSTRATDFASYNGELYYIDYADKYIHTVGGTGIEEALPITWNAETGVLGISTPDDKYISRLDIRMQMTLGSRIEFWIEYDSSGEWERFFTTEGTRLKAFTVPVRPRRCDHFRLKIVGVGEVKIYSISKTIEESE